MTRLIAVICNRCGKTLTGRAVCTACDNKEIAEKEAAFEDLVKIIKAAQTNMKSAVKKSGFSIKELLKAGLDPQAASLIGLAKKKRHRNRKTRK